MRRLRTAPVGAYFLHLKTYTQDGDGEEYEALVRGHQCPGGDYIDRQPVPTCLRNHAILKEPAAGRGLFLYIDTWQAETAASFHSRPTPGTSGMCRKPPSMRYGDCRSGSIQSCHSSQCALSVTLMAWAAFAGVSRSVTFEQVEELLTAFRDSEGVESFGRPRQPLDARARRIAPDPRGHAGLQRSMPILWTIPRSGTRSRAPSGR
jgi:hypothetical protein